MTRAFRIAMASVATLFVGLVATLGVGSLAFSAASARYCRPVVPEMVITFPGQELSVIDGSVMPVYYEDAPEPFSRTNRPKSSRFGHCTLSGDRCLDDRARYEFRTEPVRYQGMHIWGSNGFAEQGREGPGNPVIGQLRWRGPSYPHRLEIECDLNNFNPHRACAITRIVTDYEDYESEFGASTSAVARHDQCSPTTF